MHDALQRTSLTQKSKICSRFDKRSQYRRQVGGKGNKGKMCDQISSDSQSDHFQSQKASQKRDFKEEQKVVFHFVGGGSSRHCGQSKRKNIIS